VISMSLALLSLPSPSSPIAFEAGPLALTYHGLFIAVGILVGTWLTSHELVRKGYDGTLALGLLFFVVPLGFIGARIYHIVTEYDRYFGGPLAAFFRVWLGGFGIYGAIAGGFVGVVLFGWIFGVRPLVLADAAAPGLILAQAIGRWGNYFNQELFGTPTTLPWALEVDPGHRPDRYADAATFHPTFLYESLWNLAVVAILLRVSATRRLRPGSLSLLYLVLYGTGRFGLELLRTDTTFRLLGLSRNGWISLALVVGGSVWLWLRERRRPAAEPPPEEPAGGDDAEERQWSS